MSMATFASAVGSLRSVEHIEMQGEGEPLLNPDFFDMARLARRMHPNVRLSFITNGSLLTPSNIEEILAIGFEKFYISGESFDPDKFRRIRGGDVDKVIAGLNRFMEARLRGGFDRPAAGIAVTVLRDTIDDIARIAEVYEQLDLDGGFSIQPLQSMPSYRDCYDEETAEQMLTSYDISRVNRLISNHPVIRRVLRRRSRVKSFYEELYGNTDIPRQGCPWLRKGMYVTADGMLTACCFVKDSEGFGLGRIGVVEPGTAVERMREMNDRLQSGERPSMCEGCAVAGRVVESAVKETEQ
jgi:MoaA/NifB/PqqE/SkfB family radical SAM enzyme